MPAPISATAGTDSVDMTALSDETSASRFRRATAIGAIAVVLWSTLAVFTTQTTGVPPLLLVSLSFAIAFLLALTKWIIRGENVLVHLTQPVAAWMVGVAGLFGFHLLYFVALKAAPAVEANLINYLWPLLIVLFSAILPGERLRWYHVLGAAAGFAGAFLLITGGGAITLRADHALGYVAAIGSALTWASYSIATRFFRHVPTDAVGGFCLATCGLSAVCHLIFETTVWPSGVQWLAVLALGIGPVGGAFFVWDYGVKHGSVRALGAFGYAAPLLSTLMLIGLGLAPATWPVAVACVLITGGAVLGGADAFQRRTRPRIDRG